MRSSKTLNWKIYESLTKYIYETLGREFNINIIGNGHFCKVKGKSDVSHQIDVLTSESDGIKNYRTTIECKYWNKKVNKDTVMKLWAILDDSDIEKGIIVSKKGFTRDAQKFADHYNIKLVQLRETVDEDIDMHKEFEIGILDLQINSTLKRPIVLKIVAITTDGREIKLCESNQYQVFIEDQTKRKIKLLDTIMIFKKAIQHEKPYLIIAKSYEYLGCKLHSADVLEQINKIDVTGMLTVQTMNSTKVYSIVDQVWLIMKSIFEQRTFLISESGYIAEHQS